MLRLVLSAGFIALLAGCAAPGPTDDAPQATADRPTGSNIKRRDPSAVTPATSVSREELERGGVKTGARPSGG